MRGRSIAELYLAHINNESLNNVLGVHLMKGIDARAHARVHVVNTFCCFMSKTTGPYLNPKSKT